MLVQKLIERKWHARRLGGSSTNLPDIIAVDNTQSILLSIEAKAGTSDNLYVPADQIERCLQIKNMFRKYKITHAVLAFKFMRKKRIKQNGENGYTKRKLLEYYKIVDVYAKRDPPAYIRCDYDGETYEIGGEKAKVCYLENYRMPFQKEFSASKRK
jgi:Holliday junction resolvase